MKAEAIDRNMAPILQAMDARGLKTGGDTGCCWSVVTAAMTGRYVPLGSLQREAQERLEVQLGVPRYGVIPLRGQSAFEMLPSVLRQDSFSLSAVVLQGTNEGVRHRVAVFPEEGSDTCHVVDSLLPSARRTFDTREETTEFLSGRFDTGSVRLSVVASREEERKGTLAVTQRILIADDIAVQVVSGQRSPLMRS